MRLNRKQWEQLALNYYANPQEGWNILRAPQNRPKESDINPKYHAIYPDEEFYPRELFRLNKPPLGLLSNNPKQPPWHRRIAIVGTRKATPFGLTQAYEIAQSLTRAGFHIVSGLAYGIDIQAHRACLACQGPGRPIAVLPSNPIDCYPRVHRHDLATIEEHGWVFSEYLHRGGPQKWQFIARNRIIAALSAAVIVIEAPKRSGALHTADIALELGIPVIVPTGPHNQWSYQGSHQLLDEGAIPCFHPQEALPLIEHHITPHDWSDLQSPFFAG